MTYDSSAFAQDAATGRPGVIARAIADAADKVPYNGLDAAIAYATARGVAALEAKLANPRWTSAQKRWLISIDFGITEPAALEALAALPNSEVRIPGADGVLANAQLRPRAPFHPKVYMFRNVNADAPFATIVGSANLTASALATGAEAVVAQTWTMPLSPPEAALLANWQPTRAWFEHAWSRATPVAAVLLQYQARFVPGGRAPEALRDDQTEAAAAHADPGAAPSGDLVTQFAAADAMWVETHELYHNLGAANPGNQVDLRRGARVFFGFPATGVPTNSHLGEVYLQCPGHQPVARAIRYADNQMDKINLPAPGQAGPATYDDSFLLFERAGDIGGVPLFRLTVLDQAALNARRNEARHRVDMTFTGGRQHGLLFD